MNYFSDIFLQESSHRIHVWFSHLASPTEGMVHIYGMYWHKLFTKPSLGLQLGRYIRETFVLAETLG